MEFFRQLIDLFLNIDVHLDHVTTEYGAWTYGILFTIIFIETGVVVMPFLPGDSLLFAAGAIAGRGTLDPLVLFGLLASAALIGDNMNYAIGKFIGPRVLHSDTSRWFNRKHLDRTRAFFERYGGKTIILARFVPIVRTFAPFVAGVGAMSYRRFLAYDIAGAILWVGSCVFAGYFFGQFEFVKKNFELVVLAIIFISVLPLMIEYFRHRRAAKRALTVVVVQPDVRSE